MLPTLRNRSTGGVIRIHTELQVVGKHIRLRTFALKPQEKDVAHQIGVEKTSISNLEANMSRPALRSIAAVICFLGYNPLPEAHTLNGRLIRHRTSLGMTQEEAAKRLGVDAGTLARWERGERTSEGVFLGRVERFLSDEDAAGIDARKRMG